MTTRTLIAAILWGQNRWHRPPKASEKLGNKCLQFFNLCIMYTVDYCCKMLFFIYNLYINLYICIYLCIHTVPLKKKNVWHCRGEPVLKARGDTNPNASTALGPEPRSWRVIGTGNHHPPPGQNPTVDG